jgi:hypothetical protein
LTISIITDTGWEAFNALVKSLYHRHTQKGGYCNGGPQYHLKPVIRFLFRELLFRCGDGDIYFESKYEGRDAEFYSNNPDVLFEAVEAGQVIMEEQGLHRWELTPTEDVRYGTDDEYNTDTDDDDDSNSLSHMEDSGF